MTRLRSKLFLPAAAALLFPAAMPRAAGLDTLAWLAGCWQRTSGDNAIEEQWMSPRGGLMLGMSRTVRSGRAVAWESLRIVERDDALVYIATPSGQPTTEFTATTVSDSLVVFENPAHDFPQRVIYRTGMADSLWARIEGERNGQQRGSDLRMARAACPS